MMGGYTPEKVREGENVSCKGRELRETQSEKQSGGMREASMHCSPFSCSDMMAQYLRGGAEDNQEYKKNSNL